MKFKSSFLKLILTLLITAAVLIGIYFLVDDVIKLVLRIIGLFLPFIIAYLVSVLVNPLVDKLERHVKMPRNVSAIIVILFTVGMIGGIIFAIGWKIAGEVQSLYMQLPEVIENIKEMWEYVSVNFLNMYSSLPEGVQNAGMEIGDEVVKYAGELIKDGSVPVFTGIGNFAKALPKVFIWVIVFVLSLYFMVADSKTMRRVIGKCFSRRFLVRVRKIKREIKRYLGGYIKAQLIIMSIAAVILLVGLSILDIPYALLIAIAIALLDALPFFGSGAALWPWSIISFINGDFEIGVGLIIIYLAVIFTRQMIEPKIVSQSIGIYPVFTLMSMYVGYKVFSLGGMILGPIILILLTSFYKAGAFDGIIRFLKSFLGNLWAEIKEVSNYFK